MEEEIIEEIMRECRIKKRLVEELIKISINNGYNLNESKNNIIDFKKSISNNI